MRLRRRCFSRVYLFQLRKVFARQGPRRAPSWNSRFHNKKCRRGMKIPKWLRPIWSRIEFSRKLIVVYGDTPPQDLTSRHLFLAREGGEDWAVAMLCPCGCGERLELLLIKEATPNWRLRQGSKGQPSLHPSVWRKTGCKSH